MCMEQALKSAPPGSGPVCGEPENFDDSGHCSGTDYPIASPPVTRPDPDLEPSGHEAPDGADAKGPSTVTDRSIVSRRVHHGFSIRTVECGDVLDGRYELVAQIGAGGFGTVYDAVDRKLHKRVAVKVLAADLKAHPGLLERFQREAIAASQVGHPGVISISDFGRDGLGIPYLVMEFLDGRDLAVELRRLGTLPLRRALGIASQVARTLAVVHEKGVLHRDLKPANVFLLNTEDGEDQVKVVDFGASKFVRASGREAVDLTTGNVVIGTPTYMTPEQALAKQNVDSRTDVYALGIILFEMLTGHPPFTGPNQVSIISKHLSVTPPKLSDFRDDVPERLCQLIARALEKKPQDRFATMSEVATELQLTLEELESPAERERRIHRERREDGLARVLALRNHETPRIRPVPQTSTRETLSMVAPGEFTILCTDDSPTVRNQLSELLGGLGFDMQVARNGIEATQILRKTRVDMFFVDLNMQLMSGIALVKQIRSSRGHEDTPIVFMTTKRTHKIYVKGCSVGVTEWLDKPLNDEDVVDCVHRLLNQSGVAASALVV